MTALSLAHAMHDIADDPHRIIHTPSQLARSSLFCLQEIGTLHCKPAYTSKRDAINSYLFLMVLSGKGSINFRSTNYTIKQGSLVWINCNDGYSYQSSADHPLEIAWIHCNSAVIQQLYTFFFQRQKSFILQLKELSSFVTIYQEIFRLMMDKPIDFEYKISDHLHRLINLVTFFSDSSAGVTNSASSIAEKGSLIKKYIENHFNEKITLDLLSREFCISKYYMLRSFHNQYGMTIIQYLATCRIQHAKKLLRFTSLQIEEIGHACGIDDISYFNRLFRSYEGMTAGQFRKYWQG